MESDKERFFQDPNETAASTNAIAASTASTEVPELFVSDKESSYETMYECSPQSRLRRREKDLALFEANLTSVVGGVPAKVLQNLFNQFHGKPDCLQLAINEYYEGLRKANGTNINLPLSPIRIQRVPNIQPPSRTSEISPSRKREHPSSPVREIHELEKEIKRLKNELNWKRFIGNINAQAWATRPTMRPLEYGSKLVIKRLIPKTSKKTGNKFGSSAVMRLVTLDNYQREVEVGRVPEDVSKVLSPLIDLGLIELDTRVILCEKRLSTGDSFFVQIDCFLTSKSFEEIGISSTQDRALSQMKKATNGSKWNPTSETEAEAMLRLRQSSMVKLFDRLFLRPTKVSKVQSILNTGTVEDIDDDDGIIVIDENEEAEEKPIDELNLNQLKEFYKSNQEGDVLESLPESEPPSHFKLKLRNYQKQGLSWMLTREKEKSTIEQLSQSQNNTPQPQSQAETPEEGGMMNPLWKEFRWPKDNSFDITAQNGIPNSISSQSPEKKQKYFYANMYSGEFSITKPIIRSICRGGILADEMGLGKTISTLSLINSVVSDKLYDAARAKEERYAFKTTLVIVPMSLLSQWQKEFETSNGDPSHTCYVYYGSDTIGDLSTMLCSDKASVLVLTTYGTILNEWTRISNVNRGSSELPKIGLFSVKFFRIVLDEGHTIRNRTTKTTKAIYDLKSSRKWILTGTPVINRLDDIFSLIRFLELEPWSNFSYWKTFVTLPFEQKKISQTLDVIKSILEPIILRRTKNMKQKNGQPLVELPPKEVVVEEIKFNGKERKLYDWFLHRAESSFKESLKAGNVLKKYSMILTHILRLRQICCHMDLVGSANEMEDDIKQIDQSVKDIPNDLLVKQDGETISREELSNLKESIYPKLDVDNTECSICTTSPVNINDAGITSCGHLFCLSCIIEHIDYQEERDCKPLCPNCRRNISRYRLLKIRPQNASRLSFLSQGSDPVQERPYSLYLYDPDQQSSKIKALISHLRLLKEQNTGEHVVVFSQFSAYLDIIEKELISDSNKTAFTVYKFDGRLSMVDRQSILEKFAKGKENASLGKVTVLLLSLKAGGVGLNLTSASTAFLMDPWWSPSIEDQAIDRIHRIGQKSNVKVTRFIMENSIEQKMLKIQERKKQIGEAVGAEEEERRKRRIEEIQMLFQE